MLLRCAHAAVDTARPRRAPKPFVASSMCIPVFGTTAAAPSRGSWREDNPLGLQIFSVPDFVVRDSFALFAQQSSNKSAL